MGATNKAGPLAVDETTKGSGDKLKTNDYERALARLHVELVKLQQWVVHKGLKVCIVFEGRDGAGKGGDDQGHHRTCQPAGVPCRGPSRADRAREVADVHPALYPASAGRWRDRDLRPELVQSRRRRAGDGILPEEQAKRFLQMTPPTEKAFIEFGHHPAEILAGGQPGGADAPAGVPHRRRAQDLEAVADGPEVVQSLVRLFPGARRDVRGDRYAMGALVRRSTRTTRSGRG